ncbi:uncharacterized protein LOC132547572 [Ylistrum balloti]|uniref:uncharacterized protein LOC132547572 n=1 Tax=Ylistrum balloti TaxID=509963 RepID=UPI002905AAA2|nr:uncharacterized protein LOC132547572 [Ylistrum balloti]
MSAILGSFKLSQKRKAENLKIKKKQREIRKEMKAKQLQAEQNYHYPLESYSGAQQQYCTPIREEDAFDDSPDSREVVFDSEFSEWKFMYGLPDNTGKLYVIRLYRSERILYLNGQPMSEDQYTLKELHGGKVLKINFDTDGFKCEIRSCLTEMPDDQNQTLFVNGNRIQFDDEGDDFDAE